MSQHVWSTVGGLIMLAGQSVGAATITRIPTLGGSESVALSINDNGTVVGQAQLDGDTVSHAFIYKSGQITDLGAIIPSVNSTAWAVNNNDEVVGSSEFESGFGNAAMYWHNGVTLNLNAAMNASGSIAWDINDSGVIVGQGNLGPGFSKGFVYKPGQGGQSAGTLPGYMGGANLGINNAGVTVGHSYFFGDPSLAHYAVPNGRGGYDSTPIGPTGYALSIATAINNNGTVVGYADNPDGPPTACVFTLDSHNPVEYLGTLPGYGESQANAINDLGVIVGFCYSADFKSNPHAWVYMDHQMIDLNTYLPALRGSGFVELLNALSVNNHGDIVGTGVTEEGLLAGFVLTGVPAPSSAVLLALGGLVSGRRRRI